MRTSFLYIYNTLNLFMPETRAFKFRCSLLRLAGAEVGKNVRICSSAKFSGNGKIIIMDNTWIGPGVYISSNKPSRVEIGEDVDIAPFVKIITGSHRYGNLKKAAGVGFSESIVIGNGSWLGANSVILNGTVLGEGVIVAANSTVIDSVSQPCLIAGYKAKIKKKLGS